MTYGTWPQEVAIFLICSATSGAILCLASYAAGSHSDSHGLRPPYRCSARRPKAPSIPASDRAPFGNPRASANSPV